AGLLDGRGAVAPTDDSEARDPAHDARDLERSRGESRRLEQAHGPVPEHGLRALELPADEVDALRADVERHRPFGHGLDPDHPTARSVEARRDDDVDRKDDVYAAIARLLHDGPREGELVAFDAALLHVFALRREEGVRHRATYAERVHSA